MRNVYTRRSCCGDVAREESGPPRRLVDKPESLAKFSSSPALAGHSYFMALTETEIQRQKEIKQAEELLFTGKQELGFAKGLFLGDFIADWAMPYPKITDAQQAKLDRAPIGVRQFLDEHPDATALDLAAHLPREVVDGPGGAGPAGSAPPPAGGSGGD